VTLVPIVPRLRLPVRADSELVLGVLLAVAAVAAVGARPVAVGLIWLALVTPRLVAVDIAEHRLPDAVVLPALAVAGGSVLLDGRGPSTAVAAAAGYGLLLLVLHLLGGMGLGDVKLAPALGLLTGAIGPLAAVASPLLAFLAGGVAAVAVLVRRGPGAAMPFGPAMLLGAWAAVLLAR
jgi:leader peptidase (prepilin peptidase) / N-methyltransferase